MSFVIKVSRAILWNHINKIAGYGLDFVLSVVLARGLGSYFFGVYSELYNFIYLFTLVCSVGMDTFVNVFIPKFREHPNQLAALLKKSFGLSGGVSVIILILIIIARKPISAVVNSPQLESLLVIAAFYVVFFNFIMIFQSVMMSFYQTKFLFLINSLLKLSMILVAFILIRQELNLIHIIWAFTLLHFVFSVIFLIKLKSKLVFKSTPIDFRSILSFGIKAWIVKFLNYFVGRYSGIFILGVFHTAKDTIGHYNIAYSISMALSYFFAAGFAGVSLAAFSEMYKNNNKTGMATGWQAVTKLMIFLCIPIFIFCILHARFIITTVYSNEYIGAVHLFQVFALFYLISVILGSGINSTILYALRQENSVLSIRAIFGVLNVVLDVIFIQYWGAMGVIIATGIAIVGIITSEYLLLKKKLSFIYPRIFLIKIFLATILAFIGTIFMKFDGVITIILNLGLFVFLFFLILYFIKPFTKTDLTMLGKLSTRLSHMLSPLTKY